MTKNTYSKLRQKTLKIVGLVYPKYFYLLSGLLVVLYLAVFQTGFITGGDAWAESFAEYLDESLNKGWGEVFMPNWAGYFTIVPSFLSKFYLSIGGPIEYVDYYYRFIVIVFVIISALLASKLMSYTIKNTYLLLLLPLLLTMTLQDVSSFSFINVWYFGFITILLYCISPRKFTKKQDIAIGFYGALLALSKPFLPLVPLVIYRMYKSKQYAGSGIILIASLVQSYQVLFNDRRDVAGDATFNLKTFIGGNFDGFGTSLLKFFHLFPHNFYYIIAANVILLILFVLAWRKIGAIPTGLIFITFFYSVYTYVLAPDSPVYSGLRNFQSMYSFNLKSQREIVINGIIAILIIIALNYLAPKKRVIKRSLFIMPILLLLIVHKPIDVVSASTSNSQLDALRINLRGNKSTCIPLAPTPYFYKGADWFFSYRGLCHTMKHDTNLFKPDFNNMNVGLYQSENIFVNAQYFRLNTEDLSVITVPVINKSSFEQKLYIKSLQTGETRVAKVSSYNELQFAVFDMKDTTRASYYQFVIFSESSQVYGGRFYPDKSLIAYPYFIDK